MLPGLHWTSVGGALYLPVHEACLDIAHQFIKRATDKDKKTGALGNEINSMRNLWEVLYRRLNGSPIPPNIGFLPEPHDYYGGRLCRGTDWEPPNNPEDGEVSDYPHTIFHYTNPSSCLACLANNLAAPPTESSSATTKCYGRRII
jgi:hypothetical protein